MTTKTDPLANMELRLKVSTGWFAAGISFKRALTTLSDGAFKLFTYLSLESDRQTGCFESTQTELARVLKKSRRVIGRYVAELEQGGICVVSPASNQYGRTRFEILDEYWPYHRNSIAGNENDREEDAYVAAVRDKFLETGCTCGKFGLDDVKTARAMRERGVPLLLIQDALNLGACRKYDSWLNGGSPDQIASLRYFEPLVSQIQENPLPDGYGQYIEQKAHKLSKLWHEFSKAGGNPRLAPEQKD